MTPSTSITLQLWFQARGLCFQNCKVDDYSPGREGSLQCVGSAKSNRPNFLNQLYSTLQVFSSSLPPSVCTYVPDLLFPSNHIEAFWTPLDTLKESG